MRIGLACGIVFGVGILVGACGGSAEEDSMSPGEEQNLTSWSQILECENGSVIVDVDSADRRSLQLVVRDERAFDELDAMKYGQVKSSSERIYRGRSPRGVFSPSDFRHFRKYEVARNSENEMPGFDIVREGSKLTFRSLDLGKARCQPYSSGNDDVYPKECEVADYVFNSCH